MNKKYVEANEYISILQGLTDKGKEVSLLLTGNSMIPFLVNERDYIFFKKPNTDLKKGDMVFFVRKDGKYIMHRIYKIKPEGYYIVGDAYTYIEGPIEREQIFARITRVKRKGKIVKPGDFWWEFFEHIWINMIPLRPLCIKLYGIFVGLKNK